MPNAVHRIPRIRNHHKTADTLPDPGPDAVADGIGRPYRTCHHDLLAAARGPDPIPTGPSRGCSYLVFTCGAVTGPAGQEPAAVASWSAWTRASTASSM